MRLRERGVDKIRFTPQPLEVQIATRSITVGFDVELGQVWLWGKGLMVR